MLEYRALLETYHDLRAERTAKVVSPNDFPSLDQLSTTLLAFVDRYNRTAKPFNWKFTAADLAELLRRISEHEQAAPARQTDLATAA